MNPAPSKMSEPLVAVSPAAAVAAAATITAAASAAATAAAARLTFFGRVDLDGATVHFGAVKGGLGRLGFLSRTHFHETEALGAAGVAIGDQVDGSHRAMIGKESFDGRLARVVREVAHVPVSYTH